MSMIRISDLTFAYEGSYDLIFENLSLQLDGSWRLGLVGRNGRGKTTLLRLLMGEHAYRGKIVSDLSFSYFPFPVENPEEDTLSVMEKVSPSCEDWERMRELSLLGLDAEILYRPFSTLSKGEGTKVLLAALFLSPDRFFLIDEPTNHLDREAREAVGRYLSRKKGFILVSHDRALLDASVDHILAINKSSVELCRGNFSTWWANREARDNFELCENEKHEKEIGRLGEAAKRASAWSDRTEKGKFGTDNAGLSVDRGYVGHKAAKMMKRAKNLEGRIEAAIEEKSKLLHDIEANPSLALSPLDYPKETLLEARELSLFYGNRQVTGPLPFSVKRGDRLALFGKNGSGKSSLFKKILGEDIAAKGSLSVGSQLVISYVPQDTSHLAGKLSDYASLRGIDESLFKTILRKLGFDRVQFEKDMADFSGGQKKKVLIAASLSERAHLYLWDEPLNFIDLFSRMQIEELLLSFRPTLLFVEHDAVFREKVATGVLTL